MNTHFKTYLRILTLIVCAILGFNGALAADTYTVVIDAGHGGKDHGAIDNNLREKDINLAVALKAGELIKKQNKNIKVVYTRSKDEYLTLQQRADKANKAKGDLFISIHTNSVDKKNPNRTTVSGASVYTLGLHKEGNNMDVARRENSVMALEDNYEAKYSGFDPNSDESYIIFEMAQKANMTQSVKFANEVQRQLTHVAKRGDRGVRQAGFWVLWATSMPSVLVELDFICNPNSAKYMGSTTGQKQLAQSIANAAKNYFTALTQHKKNRLKAKADDEEPDFGFSEDADGVMLASATPKSERKTTTSRANTPAERTRRPGARRRRSDASREKSERQQYAVAVIQEEEVYVDSTPDVEETSAPVVVEATPVKDNKKTKEPKSKKSRVAKPAKRPSSTSLAKADTGKKDAGKKDVKKVTKPESAKKTIAAENINKRTRDSKLADNRQKKTAKKISKPATDKKKSASKSEDGNKNVSPVRLQKMATVYKIQLFSSPQLLKANNTLFCGLSPVTCIKDGEEYKYVYGESTNRNEIYQLLADVQKDIPDAVVIKVKKGVSAQ